MKLQNIDDKRLRVQDLPFSKRFGYEHEKECRLLYTSSTKNQSKLDVNIPLESIVKVTLSPWLHPDLFSSVGHTLTSVDGCKDLVVTRSTLIGNDRWREWGEQAQ